MRNKHPNIAKMSRLSIVSWLVVGSLTLPASFVNAQSASSSGAVDPGKSFSYDVSAGLLFFDELKLDTGSRAGLVAPNAPATDSTQTKRSRSLGLQYARFNGRWSATPESYLQWGLRPDALTRRSDLDSPPAIREFDTRSGSGFQQKPRVSFLDAYEMGVRRGKNLSLGAGVYEELAHRMLVYPEVLEFGMNVMFPAKASAIRMSSDLAGPESISEGLWKKGSQLQTDLYIYQGDEERAEIDGENASTYDRGASSGDPYQGAAAQLYWTISPAWQVSLFGAGGDTAIQDGKRNDFLLMLGALYVNDRLSVPMRIAAEARLRREKFNSPLSPRVPLERRALALTMIGRTFSRSCTLLGIHQGAAQSHVSTNGSQTNVTLGDQIDFGQTLEASEGLRLTFMATQERREFIDDDGSTYGAFGTRSAATRVIRRFALQLAYNFNDGGR